MPPSTAFVFVPDLFHTPAHYAPIVAALLMRDIAATAVAFPTVAADAATVTSFGLDDELRAIHAAVDEFVAQGKEVVLVAHAYGAFPASRIVNSPQPGEGRTCGIKRIVFVAAFLLPDNMGMGDVFRRGLPEWIDDGPVIRVPNRFAAPVLFSDMDEEQQMRWGALLRPQNRDGATRKRAGACWNLDMPKTCVITTEDAVSPLQYQEMALEMVRLANPGSWTVVRMASGHCPFLSRMDEMVDILLDTA